MRCISPPVVTKTWFHTGAWLNGNTILLHMSGEYFVAASQVDLPDTILPTDILLPGGTRVVYSLTGEETREAIRALKGSILRQEIYADDGSVKACLPYSVSARNYTLETLQPQVGNRYGVFFTHARETNRLPVERSSALGA